MSFLRKSIGDLEKQGQLIRITRPIDKDSELMPLVRCQFLGLPESERKAFLFENVVNKFGRKYTGNTVVSMLGAKHLVASAFGTDGEDVREKIICGVEHPIDPVLVGQIDAPVREEIHIGDSLLEHDGLFEFPIPTSTLGFDAAPFLTAPQWISKDPETGIRNVGCYRAQIKDKLKTGIMMDVPNQLRVQFNKSKAMGVKKFEAAIVLGSPQSLAYLSCCGLPYGVDETAVAGGIDGEPMRLVKCLTVDLEVPADAEIVLEGYIDTDYLEDEGPFGEMTGYMGMNGLSPVFQITCIYHRKTPIYQAFISEFPPSESSTIRGLFYEANMIKRIRGMGIEGLRDIAIWNNVASNNWCVIQMAKRNQAQVWMALRAAAAYDVGFGKYIIAVDPDVNPRDPQSVVWALCYATQPYRDSEIGQHKCGILDPSSAPQTSPISERVYPAQNGNSVIMIDATRKWPYPPVSLPAKEYMEHAKALWADLGLPPISFTGVWHGYELGFWNDELRERARGAADIMK